MPAKPPPTTPLPNRAIFDRTMPAALFQSFARLYASAWHQDYQETDLLDFEAQLLPLLGLSRSQAREHLRLLRFAKLLDWTTNGAQGYTIRFPFFSPVESGKADPVVDGFNSSEIEVKDSHQQHTGSGKAQTPEIPVEGAQTREMVLNCLARAGVWTDVAQRIAGKIVENQERGHAYLPSPADVLGWMAYCFADRRKNKIQHPAAVLAANLNANRRCPDYYRPRQICASCHLEQGYCRCSQPELGFPPEFLDFAFHVDYNDRYENFWGVCPACHGFPCQCPDESPA